MPTYEYRCDRCGENFEVFQKFTDKPLRRHPQCGGQVEKVFHARGVVFKGSGFYATDSRAKAKASSENGGSAKESNGSKSESSAKTGEKSAVTSESAKSESAKSD
ncbi:MAG TPA: FmdB family zinc ribbon protein [Acidimicrobiia bacterium]|nr:FmdB family zinc ribbon protein [Acidimicrobiia bacterium]